MNWYEDWVGYHASMFDLNEHDEEVLKLWETAFGHVTSMELKTATDWLVKNPLGFETSKARFNGKMALHLTLLRKQLDADRAITLQRERDDVDDRLGTCERCGGSGFVVVPHLRAVRGGEWLPLNVARGGSAYYTIAVLCSCAKGHWIQGRRQDRPVMSFDVYYRSNPRWEIQMERRGRELRAVSDAIAGNQGRTELERFAENLAQRSRDAGFLF